VALLSTYGYISAAFVSGPRLPYALAAEGECPAILATLHPRFHTPIYAILGFGLVTFVLAVTGTFRWALALSAGSMAVIYAGVCASLLRLRRVEPAAESLRLPFGSVLALAGVAVCLMLILQLDARHAALMLVTASLSTGNWLWVVRKSRQ